MTRLSHERRRIGRASFDLTSLGITRGSTATLEIARTGTRRNIYRGYRAKRAKEGNEEALKCTPEASRCGNGGIHLNHEEFSPRAVLTTILRGNLQSSPDLSFKRCSHLWGALCPGLMADTCALASILFTSEDFPYNFRALYTNANLSVLGAKASAVAPGEATRRSLCRDFAGRTKKSLEARRSCGGR